ncbi:hypothetical protein R1flu_001601 [Riccia fluitans]|uniref:Uncharacterized protein n=1 Tax=Riccia fluitans TaxID=41844 RepID=A0ABD1Y3R3_9MARC
MLYKEEISRSLGSLFDFHSFVPNTLVKDGPSSHEDQNDIGTSCFAGPKEVGAVNSPAMDLVHASLSPCSPNSADLGTFCPPGHEEVGVETPLCEKVLTSPTPSISSASDRPTTDRAPHLMVQVKEEVLNDGDQDADKEKEERRQGQGNIFQQWGKSIAKLVHSWHRKLGRE